MRVYSLVEDVEDIIIINISVARISWAVGLAKPRTILGISHGSLHNIFINSLIFIEDQIVATPRTSQYIKSKIGYVSSGNKIIRHECESQSHDCTRTSDIRLPTCWQR